MGMNMSVADLDEPLKEIGMNDQLVQVQPRVRTKSSSLNNNQDKMIK